MENRFLRSEPPPEGQAKYQNNIPPTMPWKNCLLVYERYHKHVRTLKWDWDWAIAMEVIELADKY